MTRSTSNRRPTVIALCGWVVQERQELNWYAEQGVASHCGRRARSGRLPVVVDGKAVGAMAGKSSCIALETTYGARSRAGERPLCTAKNGGRSVVTGVAEEHRFPDGRQDRGVLLW